LRGLLLEEELFNLLDPPQTKTEDRRKKRGFKQLGRSGNQIWVVWYGK